MSCSRSGRRHAFPSDPVADARRGPEYANGARVVSRSWIRRGILSLTAAAIGSCARPTLLIGQTGQPPTMPAEVRGYQLVASARAADSTHTARYVYLRNRTDSIDVFLTPSADDQLGAADDNADFLVEDATAYRDRLFDAYQQGQLTVFEPGSRNTEASGCGESAAGHARRETRSSDCGTVVTSELRVHGHTVQSATFWALTRAIGTSVPIMNYYSVYALPTAVVRVRALLPAPVARDEEVGAFARELIADLTSGH